MELHDVIAGLFVLAGLVGVLVVVVPGIPLQVLAVALWAFEESSTLGWVVLAVVAALGLTAMVAKFVFPGRRLRESGVPGWVLALAATAAGIGFFVVPVVGAPLGFVAAIYLFERARVGKPRAWPSTKEAMRAVLASTGIELAGGVLILGVFVAGALIA